MKTLLYRALYPALIWVLSVMVRFAAWLRCHDMPYMRKRVWGSVVKRMDQMDESVLHRRRARLNRKPKALVGRLLRWWLLRHATLFDSGGTSHKYGWWDRGCLSIRFSHDPSDGWFNCLIMLGQTRLASVFTHGGLWTWTHEWVDLVLEEIYISLLDWVYASPRSRGHADGDLYMWELRYPGLSILTVLDMVTEEVGVQVTLPLYHLRWEAGEKPRILPNWDWWVPVEVA